MASIFRGPDQFKDLNKERLEFTQEASTESCERVVVGVAASGNKAKGDRVIGRAFELAAGEDACGVAIHQDRQQAGRVVRFGAAACVFSSEPGQVKLINYFNNEAGQVVFVEPVVQSGR